MNTKKDIFQKHKDQNPKPRNPMNFQQTHNALITQKMSLCISNMSKLKKHSVAKTRSQWKLPICDDIFLRTKNHHSANPLLQRSLTNELMIGTTMNPSRLLN